jgi:hypothetical protein
VHDHAHAADAPDAGNLLPGSLGHAHQAAFPLRTSS